MNDYQDTAQWVRLVRAEYAEMPGLDLTLAQMRRLWGLDDTTCESVVHALIEEHFLARSDDGRYVLTSARL